jgi:sensor histidine kinase YesM
MKEPKYSHGIMKRMLIIVIPLVIFPNLLTNFVSFNIMNTYLKSMIINELERSNEDLFFAFQKFIDEIEENTRRMIAKEDIQNSLVESPLKANTRIEIERFLPLFKYGDIDYIIYLSNKNDIMNTIMQKQSTVDEIYNNIAVKSLLGTYGEMKLAIDYDEDKIYQKPFLYVSRFVRHLDLDLDPGLVLIRIDSKVFNKIFKDELLVKNSHYLLVDNNGIIAYYNNDSSLTGTSFSHLKSSIDINNYYLAEYKEADINWRIISFISRSDIFYLYRRYAYIMFSIVFLTVLTAILFVFYLARRFTMPISELTHAMLDFDNGSFNTRLTPYHRDEIGEATISFNHMADEINQLLNDIERKQRELRESELRSLVHQINPHFIYNILDNINMQLRLNGDKSSSYLIQCLSRFLRISLSKGHMFISLKDEIDHCRYYLEIQSIRYDNLFSYTIDIEEDIEEKIVNKFILQPVLENCISHGFSDRDKGGIININALKEGDFLVIYVNDNGTGIDSKTLGLLNSLHSMAIHEMETLEDGRSGGYGIVNVVARLRLAYEDNFSLIYSCNNEGTTCKISLPLSFINDKKI